MWLSLGALLIVAPPSHAQQATYEQLNAQLQALYNSNRYQEAAALLPAYEAASIAKFGPESAQHIETLQNIAG
ncbi:MAG: hypothetical protein JSS20_21150, partial [Proteobacteria bacterium]|nr:hypothetical protein [Pseudomonadota bacterium]